MAEGVMRWNNEWIFFQSVCVCLLSFPEAIYTKRKKKGRTDAESMWSAEGIINAANFCILKNREVQHITALPVYHVRVTTYTASGV